MGFRMLRPAATLLAVLLLAGCVPNEPVITPPPEPHSTPIFASDDDALAAATEAYAKYVKVADEVFHDGGRDTQPLQSVMTGAFLESTLQGFRVAADKGLHSVGQTTFDQVQLQQFDQSSFGPAAVIAYVCEDISGIDVLDASGKSVVSKDRLDRVRFEVTFDYVTTAQTLVISQRLPWSDTAC